MFLDVIFVKVRSSTFTLALKLTIALPDSSAVLAVRVPYLRAIKLPTTLNALAQMRGTGTNR